MKESLRTPSPLAVGVAPEAAAWRRPEATALPLRSEKRAAVAAEAGVELIRCCCCCLLLPSAAALDAEALSSRRRSTVPARARAADSGSVVG